MGSKRFEKDSIEFKMFGEFWNVCQKYYVVEPDNADYWMEMTSAMIDFGEKYNKQTNGFSKLLALSFIEHSQNSIK